MAKKKLEIKLDGLATIEALKELFNELLEDFEAVANVNALSEPERENKLYELDEIQAIKKNYQDRFIKVLSNE